MRNRILIAVMVALLVTVSLKLFRGYPWNLAFISGVLLGGLAFVTLQTLTRLKATLSQFGSNDREG